jgi:hypothetical protein
LWRAKVRVSDKGTPPWEFLSLAFFTQSWLFKDHAKDFSGLQYTCICFLVLIQLQTDNQSFDHSAQAQFTWSHFLHTILSMAKWSISCTASIWCWYSVHTDWSEFWTLAYQSYFDK